MSLISTAIRLQWIHIDVLVRSIGLKDGDTLKANLSPDGTLTIRTGKFNRAEFANELRDACQD